MNIKRLFLYVLIASVSISALLGVGVMIFGNFGEFETRILLTTTTVTITSILGLASGAYLETGRSGRLMPVAGIIFAVISGILWIISIWAGEHESTLFFKAMATTTLVAASCAHLSLLSLARLDRRFAWASYSAHGAIWTLLAILLVLIWFEIDAADNWIARTLGVLAILIGALTILTPVLHKLSSQAVGVDEIDAEIDRLRARIAELEALKSNGEEANRT